MAFSLLREEVRFDFIGSDFLEAPELRESPFVRVLNLRGDVGPDASPTRKIIRVLAYYVRLLGYTVVAKPQIFHILWNNKLEIVDRTLLLIYYRLFGKRLVLTVHNVNIRKRDGNDGLLNRLTLRAQYGLAHHLFVHTELMKRELQADFGVRDAKISVIPFGINNTVPITPLTRAEARERLGLDNSQPALLFFGNIAPYKGLEYLVDAMEEVAEALPHARLIIAGRPKGAEAYWARIEQRISSSGLNSVVIRRIEYVPDEDTEIYFKAADVLVLPYVHVFQSGVLFLGYNFGLPVIASDVGALREEIVEGQTGFVCQASGPGHIGSSHQALFRERNLPNARESAVRDPGVCRRPVLVVESCVDHSGCLSLVAGNVPTGRRPESVSTKTREPAADRPRSSRTPQNIAIEVGGGLMAAVAPGRPTGLPGNFGPLISGKMAHHIRCGSFNSRCPVQGQDQLPRRHRANPSACRHGRVNGSQTPNRLADDATRSRLSQRPDMSAFPETDRKHWDDEAPTLVCASKGKLNTADT